jgi:hypothetical protein
LQSAYIDSAAGNGLLRKPSEWYEASQQGLMAIREPDFASADQIRIAARDQVCEKAMPRRFGKGVAIKVNSYFVARAKSRIMTAHWSQVRDLLGAGDKAWRHVGFFSWIPLFPNAHIRTNAFMIDRQTFLGTLAGPIRDKKGSFRFGSGRDSLLGKFCGAGKRWW